jgi:hypothetical protein
MPFAQEPTLSAPELTLLILGSHSRSAAHIMATALERRSAPLYGEFFGR